MISLGRRMVWSFSAKSAHGAKAGLSSGRKSGASSRGRSPASGHNSVRAFASWLCLGAPSTAASAFLAAILFGAAPTLAADNFAINNATGTFTVLSCAESAGVCTLRVLTTPDGSAAAETVKIDQTTPGTTNGVQINAALPAGTSGIGNVGGKTVSVCVTPTVTASNAYGTNYVVGGKLTFANAFTATGSGILQSVAVTIKKVETSGFTFVPFNSDPTNTTWTDAAVAAINAADVDKVREPISLSAYSGLGTHTVAYATGIGQAMAPGTTSMYGVLIATAALTNQFGAASDVQICIKVLQDL